ncbi:MULTISPECIES: hypothetical protein [Aquimarina]|uniref:hypothetical protein n=1 Tax=Aquimarina TaxID=290174 RepID=UPI00135C53EF|nr:MULTISPECIES: hypothetical protein [Aquimarina]
MIKNILKVEGVAVLKRKHQQSIHGGSYGCQNVARKCVDDSDCCSGICGVERIINGRPILLSVCAF